MKILHLKVGQIRTNCYIIYDETTKDGAVIDPGDNARSILKALHDNHVNLQYILLTHGHFDHILAVHDIYEVTGAKLVIHSLDKNFLNQEVVAEYSASHYNETPASTFAEDGTEIKIGGLTARYIHTPGHTPGSSVIQVEDYLFTGDTLFRHECGRCDLPGGDFAHMLTSLKKLYDLKGDFHVLPGHEDFSMLEDERQNNPYMRQAIGQ